MAKSPRVTPIRPAAERALADSDKAYHAKLIVQHEAAAKAFQQAEQSFNQARTNLIAAEGAMQSWSVHIKEAYGLAEGEGVLPDGTILTSAEIKALQDAQPQS